MANIFNVTNDGIWETGNTVSFNFTYLSEGPFTNLEMKGVLHHPDPALSGTHGGIGGGGGEYEAILYNTDDVANLDYMDFLGFVGHTVHPATYKVIYNAFLNYPDYRNGLINTYIPPDTPEGNYVLVWVHVRQLWTGSQWQYTVYSVETYPITIVASAPYVPPWPSARPSGYDGDLVWDEVNQEWIDPDSAEGIIINAAGGGRYRRQLVVVCNGKVYYEDVI
jgi:hypothetical protein